MKQEKREPFEAPSKAAKSATVARKAARQWKQSQRETNNA